MKTRDPSGTLIAGARGMITTLSPLFAAFLVVSSGSAQGIRNQQVLGSSPSAGSNPVKHLAAPLGTLDSWHFGEPYGDGQPAKPARNAVALPVAATLLGGYGDVLSTGINFANGGHEQNPLAFSQPVPCLVSGAIVYTSIAWAVVELNRHGHPRAAKILGYGAGAFGATMTVHNVGGFHWPGER